MRDYGYLFFAVLVVSSFLGCLPCEEGYVRGPGNTCSPADDDDDDDLGEVSSICEQFLGCVELVDSDVLDEQQELFGPDSTCWDSSGEAATCNEACEGGLTAYEQSNPRVEACWPDGNPDGYLIFGFGSNWRWDPKDSCGPTWDDVDNIQSTIEGDYGPYFRIEGTIYDNDDGTILGFAIDCEFDGWDFTCEDMEGYGGDDWAEVEGDFSDGFTDADMILTRGGQCEFDGDPGW